MGTDGQATLCQGQGRDRLKQIPFPHHLGTLHATANQIQGGHRPGPEMG